MEQFIISLFSSIHPLYIFMTNLVVFLFKHYIGKEFTGWKKLLLQTFVGCFMAFMFLCIEIDTPGILTCLFYSFIMQYFTQEYLFDYFINYVINFIKSKFIVKQNNDTKYTKSENN